jgi:hypothetical protein
LSAEAATRAGVIDVYSGATVQFDENAADNLGNTVMGAGYLDNLTTNQVTLGTHSRFTGTYSSYITL